MRVVVIRTKELKVAELKKIKKLIYSSLNKYSIISYDDVVDLIPEVSSAFCLMAA